MSRRAWIITFLGVTAVALGAELWASFDSSAHTTPWTDLIVQYVPGEVTAAVIGALMVWVPVHFAIRYARQRRTRKRRTRLEE